MKFAMQFKDKSRIKYTREFEANSVMELFDGIMNTRIQLQYLWLKITSNKRIKRLTRKNIYLAVNIGCLWKNFRVINGDIFVRLIDDPEIWEESVENWFLQAQK